MSCNAPRLRAKRRGASMFTPVNQRNPAHQIAGECAVVRIGVGQRSCAIPQDVEADSDLVPLVREDGNVPRSGQRKATPITRSSGAQNGICKESVLLNPRSSGCCGDQVRAPDSLSAGEREPRLGSARSTQRSSATANRASMRSAIACATTRCPAGPVQISSEIERGLRGRSSQ